MVFGKIIGGITSVASGIISRGAADKAADAQRYASDLSIAEQRRQQAETERLFQPYVDTGRQALQQQRAFVGLGEPEAMQGQIDAVLASPLYKQMVSSGEESILQSASATGGLRGGNVKSTLAEFRPSILGQLLEQRYNRLAGLSSMGQQSVSQQAVQGQQTAGAIGRNFLGQGEATANARLAQGSAVSGMIGGVGQVVGGIAGAIAGGMVGGAPLSGASAQSLSSPQGFSQGASLAQQFGVGRF